MDRIGPVWDPGQRGTAAALAAALLIALLVSGACSGKQERSGPTGKTEESALIPATTGPETTERAPLPEATFGAEHDSPNVVLRLEGDPNTTFSGICTLGGKASVLSGRVPKRYAFDPQGQKLSCRIQKQDSGRGTLKVILIVGNKTRSVQQTNSHRGVIKISYQSD